MVLVKIPPTGVAVSCAPAPDIFAHGTVRSPVAPKQLCQLAKIGSLLVLKTELHE
jgi:hypothetical protein